MPANVAVMRDMAQHTCIEPPRRIRNLLEFISRINGNEAIQQEMDQWGVKFDEALFTVKGRVLPAERVTQGDHSRHYNPQLADFLHETRDQRLHVSVNIDSCVVICPKREESNTRQFVSTLLSVCPPMGLGMCEPQLLMLEDDQAGNYVRALHQVGSSGNLQLAIFVLPNNRKDRYDMIKKAACIDLGLHTQVRRHLFYLPTLSNISCNVYKFELILIFCDCQMKFYGKKIFCS